MAFFPNEILSSVYYIAGWHISACLKAGRIRAGKRMDGRLGKVMISLFECGTVDRNDNNNLPTEKVVRSEMFGGLNFVFALYYDFILKLEYVFVKCLISEKLAVLGNNLIQRISTNLCESIEVRQCVQHVISGDNDSAETISIDDSDTIDNDIIDNLVVYLIQTYCRMGGKDFCCQIMATYFKNLGKGVRPTLVVLPDKKLHTKKEGVEPDEITPFPYEYNLFDNLTTFYASNNIMYDNKEHNILGEDELINMHII